MHFRFGNAVGLAHANALVRGQRARAHTALMTATVHLRFKANARLAAHIQSTNAFRAVGLVRGQAHQINRQGVQVNVYPARGLRRIHMKNHAAFAANRADGRNVLNHTNLIVHVHHADDDGVWSNGGLQRFQVKQAIGLHVQVGHFKALALELAAGVEHGFVLSLDRDQVFAFGLVKMRRALDGEVVGLGCAAGPDNFSRIRTDEGGDIVTGFFDCGLGLPTPCMAARCRVAEMLAQPGNHGVYHPRVTRVGGAVVHVNGEVGRVHVSS